VGGSFNYGDTTLQGFSRQHQTVVDDSYESYGFASLSTPVGLRINSWYNKTGAASNTAYLTIGSLAPRTDRLNQHQAEVDVSWTDRVKLVIPQTLTVGTTYRWKSMEWSLLSGKNDQHHFGVYIQDVLELAKPLRLQIGARMDRHPLLSSLQFSPRGSLVYRFFGEQSIRLSAGRAFRGPSFLESYLRSDNETPLRAVSAIGLGNPKLDPESINSYEIGYQNQESDYFSLEANVYYNEVKDAILLSAVDRYTLSDFGPLGGQRAGWDSVNSAFPVSSLSFENERATFRQLGGELGVRFYPIKGLDFYSNYSVHDTSAVDKRRVSAPERANEQQTSRHKVNGGIQYRAPIGLELSADFSWLSKQLWIEQVIDTERGVRWQEYDVKPFHILSARIGWRLLNERLELGVMGTNLTMHNKRQHPYGQPFDTRVVGTAKVWF
jgi:outer membrane receptor for ferrienterochelin and colicin